LDHGNEPVTPRLGEGYFRRKQELLGFEHFVVTRQTAAVSFIRYRYGFIQS
jgi:hypothetical protein